MNHDIYLDLSDYVGELFITEYISCIWKESPTNHEYFNAPRLPIVFIGSVPGPDSMFLKFLVSLPDGGTKLGYRRQSPGIIKFRHYALWQYEEWLRNQ